MDVPCCESCGAKICRPACGGEKSTGVAGVWKCRLARPRSGFAAFPMSSGTPGRGDLVSLIGPSGCGKSTLLNAVGGLLAPSAGSIEVMGKKVCGPLPRDIAFVFQENALFPWSTVIENIELGMIFQGVAKPARAARAARALQAVGLAEFAHHYPAE